MLISKRFVVCILTRSVEWFREWVNGVLLWITGILYRPSVWCELAGSTCASDAVVVYYWHSAAVFCGTWKKHFKKQPLTSVAVNNSFSMALLLKVLLNPTVGATGGCSAVDWGCASNPYRKAVGAGSSAGDSRLHPHQKYVSLVEISEISLCPSVLTLRVVWITEWDDMRQFIMTCKQFLFFFLSLWWYFSSVWGFLYVRLTCVLKFLCILECPPWGFDWLYTSSETSLWQLRLSTKEAQDESAREQ